MSGRAPVIERRPHFNFGGGCSNDDFHEAFEQQWVLPLIDRTEDCGALVQEGLKTVVRCLLCVFRRRLKLKAGQRDVKTETAVGDDAARRDPEGSPQHRRRRMTGDEKGEARVIGGHSRPPVVGDLLCQP